MGFLHKPKGTVYRKQAKETEVVSLTINFRIVRRETINLLVTESLAPIMSYVTSASVSLCCIVRYARTTDYIFFQARCFSENFANRVVKNREKKIIERWSPCTHSVFPVL